MPPGAELVSAFSLGILSTASPCVLPLYPGFLSFLAAGGSGQHKRPTPLLGLLVLAGVLITMLAIGAVTATFSIALGSVLVFLTPLADTVLIILGVLLLAGRNVLAFLPTIGARPGTERPEVGALVYGLLYGPIALPCIAPLVVGIFDLSLSGVSFVQSVLFFLVFGLGLGVPLLLLSLLAAVRQQAMVAFVGRHQSSVTRIAGAVLVAIGAWSFWTDLPAIRLYLGA